MRKQCVLLVVALLLLFSAASYGVVTINRVKNWNFESPLGGEWYGNYWGGNGGLDAGTWPTAPSPTHVWHLYGTGAAGYFNVIEQNIPLSLNGGDVLNISAMIMCPDASPTNTCYTRVRTFFHKPSDGTGGGYLYYLDSPNWTRVGVGGVGSDTNPRTAALDADWLALRVYGAYGRDVYVDDIRCESDGYILSGHVKSGTTPIANAEVQVLGALDDFYGSVFTDSAGAYSIPVPVLDWKVKVTAWQYQAETATVTMDADKVQDFNMTPKVVNKLIDLDGSGLTPGAVNNWTNSGTLGGVFDNQGTNPQAQNVCDSNGYTYASVSLSGADRMLLLDEPAGFPIIAPFEITGLATYTYSAWLYNPIVDGEECVLCWAYRFGPGNAVQMNYGSAPAWGALTHIGGPDMGWYTPEREGSPDAGVWHHLAVTYDGAMEKVYIDGVLSNKEAKTLDIIPNNVIMLGAAFSDAVGGGYGLNFSGSVAKLQLWDDAMPATNIAELAAARPSNLPHIEFTVKHGTTPLRNAVIQYGDVAKVTDSTGKLFVGKPAAGTYQVYGDAAGYAGAVKPVVVDGTADNLIFPIDLSSNPSEPGLYNGDFEIAGAGGLPAGWVSYNESITGNDALGIPFPAPPANAFAAAQSATTSVAGANSGKFWYNQFIPNPGVQYINDHTNEVTSVVGSVPDATHLGDYMQTWADGTYRANGWTSDQWFYVLRVTHNATVYQYRIVTNVGNVFELEPGTDLLADGITVGDSYEVKHWTFRWWYRGGITVDEAHRVPVTEGSTFNFYLKEKSTRDENHAYELVWRDSSGNIIDTGNTFQWTWTARTTPSGGWAQSIPHVMLVPPAGAAWVEPKIGYVDDAFERRWWDNVDYIDDVVLDPLLPYVAVSRISDLNSIADGTVVQLAAKNISAMAGGGVAAGVFYIEESDRSSGLKINWALPVNLNDSAAITGIFHKPASGEMYIDASAVTTAAGAATKPVFVTTSTLAGKLLDGMLIRAAGKVNTVGADYFTIVDGGVETKVLCGGAPGVTANTFVSVTGIGSYDGTSRAILRP